MSLLQTALRNRSRHALVRPGEPVPAGTPDLYLWANNGVFKRGTNAVLDVLIQLAATPPVPGLAPLQPWVRWHADPADRLPVSLLAEALAAARAATITAAGESRPAEWQGHIVVRAGAAVLVSPPPLAASATRVHYTVPAEPGLVDLHSHHVLPPFYSSTDDADDAGLSVSVVLGRITDEPTLLCRLNVYREHQLVPATLVFAGLGPFRDGFADRPVHPSVSEQRSGWRHGGRVAAAVARLAAPLAGSGRGGRARCDRW